ncbi:major facilitator superfamily domain-containing protein [Durotheca rogersii]|uniref:major facilitator superfamily domain-containing protein n=1 Tax=Durotheca rogersii TaxID=419775 RepID=UPI00221E39D6|nr:major facilitator superfamily domain-containing protein [Durotheca rogersii]KAI5861000.1 major facilitator superfamily domain-containing protein [Durotheca rogersii]
MQPLMIQTSRGAAQGAADSNGPTATAHSAEKAPAKQATSHAEVVLSGGNGGTILTERDCPEALGFAFSNRKKWLTLTIIFLVQTSMNLNASLYANAQSGIARDLNVSPQSAVSGAAVFLITYAFGCELWAPWSEEFGRKPVLQCSLFLVNLCCIPVGTGFYHKSFSGVLAGRALGGLFSAGGSVTLGMVADMFDTEHQEHPLAFIVLSSVGGSIVGPIVGGFVEDNCPWQWAIWIQLLFGAFVQLLHLLLVPETRATVLLGRHAKKLRASGDRPDVYGPSELKTWREYLVPRELVSLWLRPFHMFATDLIVLVLSLLSGFSDALIFMQIQSLSRVFKLYGFTNTQNGLAFISIGLAYLIAYALYFPVIRRNRALRARQPADERAQYEARLWWLVYTAPLLPIGLVVFGCTGSPAVAHWAVPMLGCVLIGVANYTVYMATIDYMVAAYGPYSASATGGNGFARDFLAGLLTWAAQPYYDAFTHGGRDPDPHRGLAIANGVLAAIALLLVAATFAVYRTGPYLRRHSPFAQSLARAAAAENASSPVQGPQEAEEIRSFAAEPSVSRVV